MPLDFGVEIECFIPGRSEFRNRVAEGLARDLTQAGVTTAAEGYNHQLRSHWKIVSDASLSGPSGYLGFEFVSPPMSDDVIGQIDTLSRILIENGAKTNRTCGLHVHIGARHMSISAMRRLALLYIEQEDVIDSLMPPSRRGDGALYCRSVKGNAQIRDIQQAWNVRQLASAIYRGNRRVKLNFTSHWKHGTIEFRQHSGTVDGEKIKRWVYFCQKLVDIAQIDAPMAISTPEQSQALAARLAKIKVASVIYNLALRPQGVTPSEAREALGWTNTPRPHIDLTRLGVQWYVEGRRQRQKVYRIREGSPAAPTLDKLLERLEMEADHIDFWRARAITLARAHSTAEFIAGEETPNPNYRPEGVEPVGIGSGGGGGGASLGDILRGEQLQRRESDQ